MEKRVFKRKIYDKILRWKNESNGETALMIQGARRIGKSTIVEEFAKNEYSSYIVIDFNKAPDFVIVSPKSPQRIVLLCFGAFSTTLFWILFACFEAMKPVLSL